MNAAIIGTGDKTDWFVRHAKQPFLLLDDGKIADAFAAHFPRAKQFKLGEHRFNPPKGMDYRGRRNFAAALYSYEASGKDTLTVRNGKRAMMQLLRDIERLDKLPAPSKDPGEIEATATIKDMLESPVLSETLCNPTNFSFKGSVIVRLNRGDIGDFDAFILAALISGRHQGQIIITDFGFYGRPLHLSLIRQERLLCGINFLDQLPKALQDEVMLFPVKDANRCLPEDAERLAAFRGYVRSQQGYTEFVQGCVGLPTDGQ